MAEQRHFFYLKMNIFPRWSSLWRHIRNSIWYFHGLIVSLIKNSGNRLMNECYHTWRNYSLVIFISADYRKTFDLIVKILSNTLMGKKSLAIDWYHQVTSISLLPWFLSPYPLDMTWVNEQSNSLWTPDNVIQENNSNKIHDQTPWYRAQTSTAVSSRL